MSSSRKYKKDLKRLIKEHQEILKLTPIFQPQQLEWQGHGDGFTMFSIYKDIGFAYTSFNTSNYNYSTENTNINAQLEGGS